MLFVDEAGLIGRYSSTARARSYAALARWAGRLDGAGCPGLLTVFAITSDFAPAVLDERNDVEAIPGKLRASGLEAEQRLADEAEAGMRLIAREAVPLEAPSRETVQHAKDQVRRLHGRAYGWHPRRSPAPTTWACGCASTSGCGSTSGICAAPIRPTRRSR